MNPALAHLLLNHVPVLGSIFALTLLAAGLVRRSDDLVRASLVAWVLVAVATIPTHLTGDPAHEIVEELEGVSRRTIHQHEEAALPAFVALEVVGALALVSLVRFRGPRRMPRRLLAATLALAIVGVLLVARAANMGGLIRHPEIRITAPSP